MSLAHVEKRSRWPLVWSAAGIATFLMLMVYAMTHDPNLLPSQLVGKTFPAVKADFAQGGQFDLAAVAGKGRWVILNFWSTSCVVCRAEAPELERIYQVSQASTQALQRNDLGLNARVAAPLFVSINIQDNTPAIMDWIRNYRLTFPIVADKDGKISLDYGVTGTPETFFIDPDGNVRHRVAGEVDQSSIIRFIEWLEKNPLATSQDALRGYLGLQGRG